MHVLTVLVFVLIALIAAGFAAWPILRRTSDKRRWLLVAAVTLFVLGASGAVYLHLGQPTLAERTIAGDRDKSLNAVIGRLVTALRKHPGDPRAWALLGQAYMTAHDPDDAAMAFGRSIDAAEAQGQHYSFLYSAYGEAQTQAASGAVPPQAERAFRIAIALDPKDMAARYYLGLWEAANGHAAQALEWWKSLIADVPEKSELHADLVDRIAALTARSGGAAPNIQAMVEGLAARLKNDPSDMQGWQRLVRAYHVLGDDTKARAALADARKAAGQDADKLAALNGEAKELGL